MYIKNMNDIYILIYEAYTSPLEKRFGKNKQWAKRQNKCFNINHDICFNTVRMFVLFSNYFV